MSIFSFVKDAGSKLGSAVYDLLNDDEDISKPATISTERMNELRKQNIENQLKEQLGDDASKVAVTVDGDKVSMSGDMCDQASCEKAILIAGNQHGIQTVDSQVAVEQKEPEAVFYTVKSGDTLSKIAAKYYGSAGKYHAIFEANKPMLSNPDKIYPGQSLRIPGAMATA